MHCEEGLGGDVGSQGPPILERDEGEQLGRHGVGQGSWPGSRSEPHVVQVIGQPLGCSLSASVVSSCFDGTGVFLIVVDVVGLARGGRMVPRWVVAPLVVSLLDSDFAC